ncbi:MAG: septum formation initiator family protein [Bacteroidales bacterium]|nr:septum formation initiator family protein [Bacteroidales bacterium]
MFRKIYDRIPRFIRNKYFLVLLVFVVWMLFLDRNNFMSQIGLWSDLHKLQEEKKFYLDETAKDSVAYYKLMNDSIEAEKIGREKYMMKRDSEDIFLVVKKPKVK